jgi:hypothetical protein
MQTDTQFFTQALEEWIEADPETRSRTRAQSLSVREMSLLLSRAQELKSHHQQEQP